jgi:preprotein translocase subunit SecY
LIYVLMRGLEASPGYTGLVIFQLILGGFAIFYMNELSEKWGFGSGVSLFIGAGVSWRLFTQAFQFINSQGQNCLANFGELPACPGEVFTVFESLINQNTIEMFAALATIVATALIFLLVVWAQSLKVEIPLSYGRLKGYGVKWPLNFFYASVIPVILVAALMANIQVIGGLIENWVGHATFLGGFDGSGQATSGLAFWVSASNLLDLGIRGGLLPKHILQGIIHIIVFTFLATVFSVFWVKTSGMDAKNTAKKIQAQGLQIAGFRQDTRILENILDRYIMPLTIMGGAAIGLLAATTDLLGALVSGTAMLLVIMVFYQFYQNIAKQHMTDMNPAMRKFMGN